MTRKLELEFNLPPLANANEDLPVHNDDELEDNVADIVEVENAITLSEKINNALAEVRGMEVHDSEMDEIAKQAIDSYEQLMSLGMNMTDMAAGPVFANAANMLKIALEAKDNKVHRKLKQIDLMLKKSRLDQQAGKKDTTAEELEATTFDRNELLKLIAHNK